MERCTVVLYKALFEAAHGERVEFKDHKFEAYPADEVVKLAKRVLEAICAYEPLRVVAELNGSRMSSIFESDFIENLTDELEQIVKESSKH